MTIHDRVTARRRPTNSSQQHHSTRRPARRRRARVTTALAGVTGLATATLIAAAPAASASGLSCWAGFDGDSNTWVWGSCTNVSGNAQWRLRESCTWGLHAESAFYTDSRRVDIHCPAGTRAASGPWIEIIYS